MTYLRPPRPAANAEPRPPLPFKIDRRKRAQIKLPEVLGYASSCQFIAGDSGADASICGKRSQDGSSYCAAHHALCRDGVSSLARSEAGHKAWETQRRRYGERGARMVTGA